MDIFLCDSGLGRGIKQLASKVKKGATKRQRTRDTSDDDYNPSVDLDAQSSMGDYSMNTDDLCELLKDNLIHHVCSRYLSEFS